MNPLLAVEIGGTKLQLATGEADGSIEALETCRIVRTAGAEGIRSQIQSVLPTLLRGRRPRAAAVGFGGPVDVRTGRVCRSHQIEGWSGFDLGLWLERVAGCPVRVENDANLAALGEALRGAGAGCNPVFYVTMGSGVGGGLVVDGAVYHGALPGESEVGHVRLDRLGTTVESRCSGWAVNERIRAWAAGGGDGLLARLGREDPGHEARHWGAALAAGDPAATTLLEEVASDLALGLSHVLHLFHPEVVILGGGLSLVGEPLRRAVEEALRPLLMEVFRPGLRVALARLGETVVPAGGLLAAGRIISACP